MTAYLTASEFGLLSLAPQSLLDEIEDASAGWIDAQLETQSRWIDARLSKRYAAPFESPYPEVVRAWLARLVTFRCYLRRGVDPTDAQMVEIKADRESALLEILEAANLETGLIELPLREGEGSGISRGNTQVYAEASPYVFADAQADIGRNEDSNRGGTFT